jgi:hypothetical protein
MKAVSLARVKERVVETGQDEGRFLPLLLFRGNTSLGRAQSLWNFTLAIKDAEVENLTDIAKMSATIPLAPAPSDVAHLCGLHHSLNRGAIQSFFSRVLLCPEVAGLEPNLVAYLRHALNASRAWPLRLDRIPHTSPWSKRPWRRVAPSRVPADDVEIPSFWPFLTSEPADEHTLLIAVDRAVPKNLPESVRQDVCQDLIVAVLSGETTLEDLQDSLGSYIKSVFRRFPVKYGPLSLDSPPPWTFRDADARPLGVTLPARETDPLDQLVAQEEEAAFRSIAGDRDDIDVRTLHEGQLSSMRRRLAEAGLVPPSWEPLDRTARFRKPAQHSKRRPSRREIRAALTEDGEGWEDDN